MNKFTADIGSWAHGKNVELPKSTNVTEALNEAQEILKVTKFRRHISDPYVVQIRHDDKLVWDYFNGSLESVTNYPDGKVEIENNEVD